MARRDLRGASGLCAQPLVGCSINLYSNEKDCRLLLLARDGSSTRGWCLGCCGSKRSSPQPPSPIAMRPSSGGCPGEWLICGSAPSCTGETHIKCAWNCNITTYSGFWGELLEPGLCSSLRTHALGALLLSTTAQIACIRCLNIICRMIMESFATLDGSIAFGWPHYCDGGRSKDALDSLTDPMPCRTRSPLYSPNPKLRLSYNECY